MLINGDNGAMRIEAKDERKSVLDMQNELYRYICQYLQEDGELRDTVNMDCHEFVLDCLWNFRQK
jgi:hypothetical protein